MTDLSNDVFPNWPSNQPPQGPNNFLFFILMVLATVFFSVVVYHVVKELLVWL